VHAPPARAAAAAAAAVATPLAASLAAACLVPVNNALVPGGTPVSDGDFIVLGDDPVDDL
jgi:hypothetical protein